MRVIFSMMNDDERSPEERRATERALYLLGYRDHSYKELFDKLEKNYESEICLLVCDKMTQMRLINDVAYAEKLAKNLVETRLMGLYRAKQQMRYKGLSTELIEEALAPYDEDVLARLVTLIGKKYARLLTNDADEASLRRVKGALARAGYGYSDINAALEIYTETSEEW